MSLFSSIFSKEQPKEEPRPEEKKPQRPDYRSELPEIKMPEPKKPGDPVSVLHTDLVVSLMQTNGQPIFAGKISVLDLDKHDVTLVRNTGQLAFELLEPGTPVLIRTFLDHETKALNLRGVIAESTRTSCKISKVEPIPFSEQRDNFRLFLNVPITMYYPDDERMENPEVCKLINISTGGACVESEFIHGEGEVLRIRIQLADYAPMIYIGQVLRVEEPKPNVFRYGILFAQLSDKEMDILTRTMFNIQMGYRDIHLRHNYGHW